MSTDASRVANQIPGLSTILIAPVQLAIGGIFLYQWAATSH